MYFLNQKTLAYFKARPMLTPMNRSEVSLPFVVSTQLNSYMQNKAGGAADVQESAIKFYLLNHGFAALCQKYDDHEVMSDDAVKLAEQYFQLMSPECVRLMWYVLLIITRESRHLHASTSFKAKLVAEHGATYVQFRDDLPASSNGSVTYFRNHPPSMTLGAYVSAVVQVFNEGSFSGGYGGKPWGNIAETLRKLVYGETSYETFLDTAWTLAHNNGPMFNKGMLYEQYNSDIYKILDVQRSGQIPQLVNQAKKKELKISGMTASLYALHDLMLKVVPEVSEGYVDWAEVEKFGLKKYPSELAAQVKKYGPTASMAEAVEEEKKKFWVTKDEFVKIKTRKVA